MDIGAAGQTSFVQPFDYVSAVQHSPLTTNTTYLIGQTGLTNPTFSVLALRDRQPYTVFSNQPSSAPYVTLYGDQLQAIMLANDSTATENTWAFTSTNTSVPLTVGLHQTYVSVYRDTIHVVGVEPTTNGGGQLVLYRYRETTGLQRMVIQPIVPIFEAARVITTAEGGAFIAGYDRSYAVGSTSTDVVVVDMYGAEFEINGAARGESTFIIGNTNTPTSRPALFAYDERSGGPQLTRLTPDTSGSYAYALDPNVGPQSGWFVYGEPCVIERIDYVNNAPQLESIPCIQSNDTAAIGTTSNGSTVAYSTNGTSFHLYVVNASGAAEVARLVGEPVYIRDPSMPGNPIIGWYGTDAMGGVACLANHPERCWKIDGDREHWEPIATHAGANGEDSFAIMSTTTSGTSLTIEIVRTLDHGDRVPPLL